MPRWRSTQNEVLPFPDEDPTGRGGGWILRKQSRRAQTRFEQHRAAWAGLTVAELHRIEREAQARSREAQRAEQHDSPEQQAENLRRMAEWANESRREWLRIQGKPV